MRLSVCNREAKFTWEDVFWLERHYVQVSSHFHLVHSDPVKVLDTASCACSQPGIYLTLCEGFSIVMNGNRPEHWFFPVHLKNWILACTWPGFLWAGNNLSLFTVLLSVPMIMWVPDDEMVMGLYFNWLNRLMWLGFYNTPAQVLTHQCLHFIFSLSKAIIAL